MCFASLPKNVFVVVEGDDEDGVGGGLLGMPIAHTRVDLNPSHTNTKSSSSLTESASDS